MPALGRWWQTVLVGAAAGFALGVLTQILQGTLPDNVGTLVANSGAAWAVVAFAVGALMASDAKAAVAGAITLIVASFAFSFAVDWFEHGSSGKTGAAVWALAGAVAGPVFAVAGRWARSHPARRAYSLALVAGVLWAEGAHLIWWVGVDNLKVAGVIELIVAATITGWSLRVADRRWLVIAVVVAAGLTQRVAYEVVDRVFSSV